MRASRSFGHAVLLCWTLIGACSSGPPAPAEPGRSIQVTEVNSGFLSDYGRLAPAQRWPTLLVRLDMKARPQKIHLRPVEIWRGGTRHEVHEQDLPNLADALARVVRTALSESFEVVAAPGPGVHELRMALTHAGPDARRYVKQGGPLGRRTGPMGMTTRNFVRVAALEAELLEPGTVRATVAVLDRRAADELPKGAAESWEDVHHAFSLWGERLRAVFQAAGPI
ncbi:MAG TPA: DUF3313 family protein [Candidatus Limnocylindrales bacterium]|nr:DUF3313 family protein [Candidatus Limnocylindrales bacterium]